MIDRGFILWCTKESLPYNDDIMLGVFSSENEAAHKIHALVNKPGFRSDNVSFHVDEVLLNEPLFDPEDEGIAESIQDWIESFESGAISGVSENESAVDNVIASGGEGVCDLLGLMPAYASPRLLPRIDEYILRTAKRAPNYLPQWLINSGLVWEGLAESYWRTFDGPFLPEPAMNEPEYGEWLQRHRARWLVNAVVLADSKATFAIDVLHSLKNLAKTPQQVRWCLVLQEIASAA